jgi:zinc transport system substrate-binding protein
MSWLARRFSLARVSLVLLSAALAAALAGGVARAGEPQGALKVVVTIKPIHSLVVRLLDGVAVPQLLVKGSASPHAFALKPSDVRALNDANVFIRVSDALEPFTRSIVNALPKSVDVVTLAEAPGVKLLEQRSGGTFEAHGEHGEHGEHESGDDLTAHGVPDGHIWLDPDNAKVIVAHLADVLSRHAPQYSTRIKENAARLAADLDALTATTAAETAPLKGKPFIVFHDAYQYFERRFGLEAAGAITVSPEQQPSAKRLSELRRKIAALGAVCVFAEPLFQPGLVAAVTEGSRAHAGTLDPEGMGLEPGGDLYFKLMRNLAAGFRSCLAQPS